MQCSRQAGFVPFLKLRREGEGAAGIGLPRRAMKPARGARSAMPPEDATRARFQHLRPDPVVRFLLFLARLRTWLPVHVKCRRCGPPRSVVARAFLRRRHLPGHSSPECVLLAGRGGIVTLPVVPGRLSACLSRLGAVTLLASDSAGRAVFVHVGVDVIRV